MESRLDVYEDRLLSFTNWPHGLHLKPAVMAAAGFYHSNWDSDEVTCFHCNVSIDQWDRQTDPFKHHLLLAPTCTFVNKSFMSALEERLASFHTWPLNIKPLPIRMAAAGFYHSNRQTDAATCFCCTLRLEDWKREDDPIHRHTETAVYHCAWLEKITTVPKEVVTPVRRKAAPMWDHRRIPRKCGECRKVFASGNQFRKHQREAHPRRAMRVKKEPRPLQGPLGAVMLGRHRVTKSVGRVRMPRRAVNSRVAGLF